MFWNWKMNLHALVGVDPRAGIALLGVEATGLYLRSLVQILHLLGHAGFLVLQRVHSGLEAVHLRCIFTRLLVLRIRLIRFRFCGAAGISANAGVPLRSCARELCSCFQVVRLSLQVFDLLDHLTPHKRHGKKMFSIWFLFC